MKIFKDGHFCLSLNYYFNLVCKILGLTVNIFVCKKTFKKLKVFFRQKFRVSREEDMAWHQLIIEISEGKKMSQKIIPEQEKLSLNKSH